MQVVCSAEADIDHLFELGDPSEYDKHHARVMAGDLDIAVVSLTLLSSYFQGDFIKFFNVHCRVEIATNSFK